MANKHKSKHQPQDERDRRQAAGGSDDRQGGQQGGQQGDQRHGNQQNRRGPGSRPGLPNFDGNQG